MYQKKFGRRCPQCNKALVFTPARSPHTLCRQLKQTILKNKPDLIICGDEELYKVVSSKFGDNGQKINPKKNANQKKNASPSSENRFKCILDSALVKGQDLRQATFCGKMEIKTIFLINCNYTSYAFNEAAFNHIRYNYPKPNVFCFYPFYYKNY